ncbi:MAG: hypothetical protein RLZZ597_3762, partial [Cyanobacteriota bacterium]
MERIRVGWVKRSGTQHQDLGLLGSAIAPPNLHIEIDYSVAISATMPWWGWRSVL